MFEKGVLSVNPVHGATEIGTFSVEHWRAEDAHLQRLDALNWGTTRTLEQFDQKDMADNLPVVVFHTGVDVATRICQNCGRTAGLPRVKVHA